MRVQHGRLNSHAVIRRCDWTVSVFGLVIVVLSLLYPLHQGKLSCCLAADGKANEPGRDRPEKFPENAADVKNRIQEGLSFLKSKEFKFAEEEWTQASRLNPRSGDADFYLGLLKYKQGELVPALRKFQEAAQRDSTRYDACNNAAAAGFYAKRTTQLAKDFRNAKDRVVPGASQFIADNMARVLFSRTLNSEHGKQVREVYREAMRDLGVAPFDPAKNITQGPLFIVPQAWRDHAPDEMDFGRLGVTLEDEVLGASKEPVLP